MLIVETLAAVALKVSPFVSWPLGFSAWLQRELFHPPFSTRLVETETVLPPIAISSICRAPPEAVAESNASTFNEPPALVNCRAIAPALDFRLWSRQNT
jgi:hypothetical protein